MSRLQPRSKAQATSNISSQAPSALASVSNEPLLRSPSVPRPSNRVSSPDPLSERATLALIRRTLCSQLGDKGRSTPAPIDELLPPLTSSNEVDLQLYAFIAIIIREFVQAWYTKITPDQVFVEEIVKLIAHCTRALEQRLRKVDLEGLLLDELPELLEMHVQAYRISHRSSHPLPLEQDPRQIYHSLWPLPPLSPVPDGNGWNLQQLENEAAYRELVVQGVLAILLPTEDLENDCLTSLVGQIFSEMIIGGGIGGKACEPWLLWEGITKIAQEIQTQLPKSKAQVRVERSNSDLMDQRPSNVTGGSKRMRRFQRSVQKTFWLVLQYGFLAFTAIRFFIVTLATSSSLPSRISLFTPVTGPTGTKDQANAPMQINTDRTSKGQGADSKRPILKMNIWSCASTLLDLDVRMPWLSGALSLLQWGALMGPGGVGKTDGMVDKILSHAIQTKILDPKLLPLLLRNARAALFPNNAPAPPRIIPSPAEQLAIRQRCAQMILSLIPTKVQRIYFGGGEERRTKEVEDILDVFDDSYCNKHLLYSIVELVIVRLIPEMGEKGIEELLEERLN